METIFVNTENSKKNESNFFINLLTSLMANLMTSLMINLNKDIVFANLSIYYTCKDVKKYAIVS